MPAVESTSVGFRLRMAPSDLSIYPDAAKLVWYGLVLKYGLEAKLRDLRRGKDKDGVIHPLAPGTIKNRKSEVGPVTKSAPRGIPSLDRSRVMSLLTGRAHTSSCEIYWGFDSITGRSFAVVLHEWADHQGHDVFGLSQASRDWTLDRASRDWDRWLASAAAARILARPGIPGAKLARPAAVLRPVAKVPIGGTDLSRYDLAGGEDEIKRAIDAGRFPGFRRLNTRGEQWKPQTGDDQAPGQGLAPKPLKPKPTPTPKSFPKPEPTPTPKPVGFIVAGNPPQSAIDEFSAMHATLSKHVQEKLENAGFKHVFAERLIDHYPELKGVSPRGWGSGTWDNSDGVANWDRKEILIARTRKMSGTTGIYTESTRLRGVFFHETGHGLDIALGRHQIQGFEFTSQNPWFEAYANDFANIDAQNKAKLSYYIQEGDAGRQETFAELFANVYNASVLGERIDIYFPRCMALLRSTLESLK